MDDHEQKRNEPMPEGDRQNEADRARHHQWQRNPGGIGDRPADERDVLDADTGREERS